MSRPDADRCCWRILIYSWWSVSPGLPQGVLFTRILCNSLFRLCAFSDISAYLTRTVETETTKISTVCHSIRMVQVVRWHHIRTIALSSRTSWSWATKVEPALLVLPCGFADPTWVAIKLAGYFSLGYTIIIQDVDGSPFFALDEFCAVSIVNIPKYKALQWVLICHRLTFPVLWLRSGHW